MSESTNKRVRARIIVRPSTLNQPLLEEEFECEVQNPHPSPFGLAEQVKALWRAEFHKRCLEPSYAYQHLRNQVLRVFAVLIPA